MKSLLVYFGMFLLSGSFILNRKEPLAITSGIYSENILVLNQTQTDSVNRVAKKLLAELLKNQIQILENHQETKHNLQETKFNLKPQKPARYDYRQSKENNAYRD